MQERFVGGISMAQMAIFYLSPIDFKVPFMPLPTIFKLCWRLFTHSLQTINPIKIQNVEHAKSIAKTSEKQNIKAMKVKWLFWPYLINPEN